ncbi:hypothetical protein SFRURICE_002169 [Spodoptera frugiperda]|nr:hypothetical protein SFRURICE_002169 [Spodoptera frugiperda]
MMVMMMPALFQSVCKHTNSHVDDTSTRNNNLWSTQRVAPCGNRTRYTFQPVAQPLRQPCSLNIVSILKRNH